MLKDLPQDLMDKLLAADSPTISNAIELYECRSRWAGYMGPEIQCRFPDLGRVMGYATTCTIRDVDEDRPPDPVVRLKWLESIRDMPKPVICVVKDNTSRKGWAAHWGEIMGTMIQELGSVAIVTDGAVRDLEALHAIGMKVWSEHVVVSHAWIDVEEADIPVEVGGLTVKPGDILHADCNGVISIPHDILEDLPNKVKEILDNEKKVLADLRAKGVDFEKMREGIKH